MKSRLISLSALGFALVSCDTGGSIRSGYDPLDAAGGLGARTNVVDAGHEPGDFVTTIMDNTGFFKTRPQGNADAERLLPASTSMKVVSDDGSFVKVELDSGEVGYVSSIQVAGENQVDALPVSDSAVQVWPPPSGGIQPLEDTGVEDDPDVPVVPTDIDPDAPVEEPTLPEEDPDAAVELPPLPDPVGADEEAAGDDAAAAPGE